MLRHGLAARDDTLDFRRVLDSGTSLLINLALLSPDARRLLGCLLTVGMESAALARANVPNRPPPQPSPRHRRVLRSWPCRRVPDPDAVGNAQVQPVLRDGWPTKTGRRPQIRCRRVRTQPCPRCDQTPTSWTRCQGVLPADVLSPVSHGPLRPRPHRPRHRAGASGRLPETARGRDARRPADGVPRRAAKRVGGTGPEVPGGRVGRNRGP